MKTKLKVATLSREYQNGITISNPILPISSETGRLKIENTTNPDDPKIIDISPLENNDIIIREGGEGKDGVVIPSELIEAVIVDLIKIRFNVIETEPPPFEV